MKDTGIYMENETLGNFARNTAAMLEPEGEIPARREAAATSAVLRRLKSKLSREDRGERTGAMEWFSDNWYLAEREGLEAAARLKTAGRLPKAPEGRSSCVSEAASALIRSGRGRVTGERLGIFLDEYQKNRVLTQRELSVFVPELKSQLCLFLEEVMALRGNEEERTELAGNIFTSLRLLGGLDVSDILEGVNRVEALLRRDPAGVYTLMDEETRDLYRRELSKLAARHGITEEAAAEKVLELAENGEDKHVGTYILQKPLGRERRPASGGTYMGVIVLSTLFFSVLLGVLSGSVAAFFLAVLPISEIVKNLTDLVCLRLIRPRALPKLELEGGIPKKGRTVCVISALLTGPGDGKRYAKML